MSEDIIKKYISSGLISESDYECLKSAIISFGISSDDIFNGIVKSIESIKIEKEDFTKPRKQYKEEFKAIRSLYRRR